MKRARTLVLAGLALVALGCASRPDPPVSRGPGCTSLAAEHAATIRDTTERTLPRGVLRVPVVIHLMSDPEDPPDRRPEAFWTPALIDRYFGTGNSSVSAVWAQARIHFDLSLVERCPYTPPAGTFEPGSGNLKGMLTPDDVTLRAKRPAEQQTIVDHYLRLNAVYGVPRTLNVYFWRNIRGAVNAYGESPWRGRPEVEERNLQALSTVWHESHLGSCRQDDLPLCQRRIAHEVGHALGLRHTCRVCSSPTAPGTCCTDLCWAPPGHFFTCAAGDEQAPRWKGWCVCEGNPCEDGRRRLSACGERLGCCDSTHDRFRRLMFPDLQAPAGSGTDLCPGEIDTARSAVREFFHTRRRGGGRT